MGYLSALYFSYRQAKFLIEFFEQKNGQVVTMTKKFLL
jgi:hypothetical protein